MSKKSFKKPKVYEEKERPVMRSDEENQKIAQELINKLFPEQIGEEKHFKDIHNGYTNFSYLVTFKNGAQYQVRIPHDGNIINRELEHDLIHNYLKNDDFIYFDSKTGVAVKKWLPGKCPSKWAFRRSNKLLDSILTQIKQLHKIPVKKDHKFKVIKFDAYNQNLYRLKFIYKKKFLCLIDRRRRDEYVINHSDINPLNLIYNKETGKLTLIDFEWVGLASDYFDYANFVRETGVKYKKVDWSKYIDNFDMQIFEHYLFMVSMYAFLWTYAMPQTSKIVNYRFKTYKQIKKYYPAVINVDKSCYVEREKNEKA